MDLTRLLCFYLATAWCRDTVRCLGRVLYRGGKAASMQNSAFPCLYSTVNGWLAFSKLNVEILS